MTAASLQNAPQFAMLPLSADHLCVDKLCERGHCLSDGLVCEQCDPLTPGGARTIPISPCESNGCDEVAPEPD